MRIRSTAAWGTLLLALTLVVGACASSDPATSSSTAPAPAPSTTVAGEDPTVESAPPTTAGEQPPTYAELEDLAYEGQIAPVEVALTGFSLLFGVDIDGALPVTEDDTLPREPTPVVNVLRALDDQLTDGQRTQIKDVLDQVRSSARLLYESESLTALGTSEAAGVSAIAPADELFARNAGARAALTDAELQGIRVAAESYVMSKLGGERPTYRMSLIDPEDRVGDQVNWAGWASTELNEDGKRVCDSFIVNFPTTGEIEFKATIVHEFFHCWHGQNTTGTVNDHWYSPQWIIEGLAEWVENEYTEGRARTSANRFMSVPIGKLFAVKYPAVAFFWQINDVDGGPDRLWNRIPTIAKALNNASGFEAATEGLSPEKMAQFGSAGAQLGDRGAEWSFPGRNRNFDGTPRPMRPQEVSTAAYDFVRPGHQRLVQFTFPLGTAEPWVIQMVQNGLSVSAWEADPASIFVSASNVTTWCLNAECVCEDGRNLFPDARPIPGNEPTFTSGLTGGATQESTISAKVTNVKAACDDDGELPTDLVGVWIADPAAVVDAYAEAYAEIGIGVTGAAGELSMTLADDNTVLINYDEVRLALDDPFVDEVIVSGSAFMNWRTDDGRLVFFGPTTFIIGVLTPSISSEALVVRDTDIGLNDGSTTADYRLDRFLLSLSNIAGSLTELPDGSTGVLVLPTEWIRAVDISDPP